MRLLEAVLVPRDYEVLTADSGEKALELVAGRVPDLVLLDILRRVRGVSTTPGRPGDRSFADRDDHGQRRPREAPGLDAGADDFVAKPFDKAELLARVRSLLRVKQYHDVIQAQAAELAEWNRELEARVAAQVHELERLQRLRRFLSPQIAELVAPRPTRRSCGATAGRWP